MATLATYRAAVAPEVGLHLTSTATSGSSTSQLEDTAWPISSTISQDDLYTDKFLYRPSAAATGDKNRTIKTYTPTSGLLIPDKTWANSPASEAYEILGMFDAATLHGLINEGLKRCYMVVEVTGTPTLGDTRHGLNTIAPWLTDPTDVLQVGYLATGEDRDQTDPYRRVVRGTVYNSGGTFYLDHHPRSFNATDTLYFRVLKRAYDHCRASAGEFGDQSGLSLETDEAPAAADWVTAATLLTAWRRFGHLLDAANNGKLLKDRAEAAAWFSKLTNQHLVASMPPRTLRRRGTFGPAR